MINTKDIFLRIKQEFTWKNIKYKFQRDMLTIYFAIVAILLGTLIVITVETQRESRGFDIRDEERYRTILCVVFLPTNTPEDLDNRTNEKAKECEEFNSSRPKEDDFNISPPEHNVSQGSAEKYYVQYSKNADSYKLIRSSTALAKEPIKTLKPQHVPTNPEPKKYEEDCINGQLRIKYENRLSWQSTGQTCVE